MKFLVTALLALLPVALAAKSLTSVIVSFPEGTPSGVVEKAKDAIVAGVSICISSAGGDTLSFGRG